MTETRDFINESCKQALLIAIERGYVDLSALHDMSLHDIFTKGLVVTPSEDKAEVQERQDG